ncbi:hypothetical protein ACWD68_37910, partial [Streptomyces sp. NPDC005141]
QLKPEEVELTDDEIAQAEQLIDRLTRDDLEGDDFTDRYTEAVEQLIEAKRENREPPTAEEPETPGQVVDLMAALKESVAKAKASRGEDATIHDMPKKKPQPKGRRPRRRQRSSPPRRQPRRRQRGSRGAAPEPAGHPAAFRCLGWPGRARGRGHRCLTRRGSCSSSSRQERDHEAG